MKLYRKTSALFILIFLIIFSGLTFAQETAKIKVKINGIEYNSIQTIKTEKGNILFSAIDFFGKPKGFTTSWYTETNLFAVGDKWNKFAVQKDDSYALINGKKVNLDEKIKIVKGKPYLPMNVLNYFDGYELDWDETSQTIHFHEEGVSYKSGFYLCVDVHEFHESYYDDGIISLQFELLDSKKNSLGIQKLTRNNVFLPDSYYYRGARWPNVKPKSGEQYYIRVISAKGVSKLEYDLKEYSAGNLIPVKITLDSGNGNLLGTEQNPVRTSTSLSYSSVPYLLIETYLYKNVLINQTVNLYDVPAEGVNIDLRYTDKNSGKSVLKTIVSNKNGIVKIPFKLEGDSIPLSYASISKSDPVYYDRNAIEQSLSTSNLNNGVLASFIVTYKDPVKQDQMVDNLINYRTGKYNLQNKLTEQFGGMGIDEWLSPYNRYKDSLEPRSDDYITIAQVLTIAAKIHAVSIGQEGLFERGTINWYDNVLNYAFKKGIILKNEFPDLNKRASAAEVAHILKNSLPKELLNPIYFPGEFTNVKASSKYAQDINTLYNLGILTANAQFYESDNPVFKNSVIGIADRIVSNKLKIDSRPDPEYYSFYYTGSSTFPYFDRVNSLAKKLKISLPSTSTSYLKYFELKNEMLLLDQIEKTLNFSNYKNSLQLASNNYTLANSLLEVMNHLKKNPKLDTQRWAQINRRIPEYIKKLPAIKSQEINKEVLPSLVSSTRNLQKMYTLYSTKSIAPTNYSEDIFTLYQNHTYGLNNQLEYDQLIEIIKNMSKSDKLSNLKIDTSTPYWSNMVSYIDGTANLETREWVEQNIPEAMIILYSKNQKNFKELYKIMTIVHLFNEESDRLATENFKLNFNSQKEAYSPLYFIAGNRKSNAYGRGENSMDSKSLDGRQQLVSAVWDYFGYETTVYTTRDNYSTVVKIGDDSYVMDVQPESMFMPEYHWNTELKLRTYISTLKSLTQQ